MTVWYSWTGFPCSHLWGHDWKNKAVYTSGQHGLSPESDRCLPCGKGQKLSHLLGAQSRAAAGFCISQHRPGNTSGHLSPGRADDTSEREVRCPPSKSADPMTTLCRSGWRWMDGATGLRSWSIIFFFLGYHCRQYILQTKESTVVWRDCQRLEKMTLTVHRKHEFNRSISHPLRSTALPHQRLIQPIRYQMRK